MKILKISKNLLINKFIMNKNSFTVGSKSKVNYNKYVTTLLVLALGFTWVFGFVSIVVDVSLKQKEAELEMQKQELIIAKNLENLGSSNGVVLGATTDLNKEKLLSNIFNSVLPSGMLSVYPVKDLSNKDKVIVPYWANLAVCGLATELKFGNYWDKKGLEYTAWNVLDWYRYRQDPKTGYVQDYIYDKINKTETASGDMDSVDSYSATYIKALDCMYKATGDKTKLASYYDSAKLAYKSIMSVMDDDNLTWAKPSYKVKYLMDNIEVVSGFNALSSIAKTLGDKQFASQVDKVSSSVESAINKKMWNRKTLSYDWAITNASNGSEIKYTTDWSVYYPDALENVWVGAFKKTDSSSFETNHYSKTASDRFLVTLEKYTDNGISGSWNPFIPLSIHNSGRQKEAKSIMEYGIATANEGRLGGLYTSGHSGLFLIDYYLINKNQSLF